MKAIQNQSEEAGQGLVSYLVLSVFSSGGGHFGGVSVVGRNIREQYEYFTGNHQGDGQSQRFSEVNERQLEARGFQNYMENTDAAKASK
jgi:hypothetical protein